MYDVYLIKAGDTLDSIANKYGITTSDIIKINGELTELKPGMYIVVPKIKNNFFDMYTIKKGDNLYKIAKEYGVDENLLAQLNGLNKTDYIYPNQTIMVPKKGVKIYVTGEGDTLQGVINGLRANLNTLMNQNSKLYLYPGQLIVFKEI